MQDNNWQDHFFGLGLNFGVEGEKPDKFYRHIGILQEGKCPECGETFFYQNVDGWAYKVRNKHGHTLLCRYSCMRKCQAKREKELEEAKARTKARRKANEAMKKRKLKDGA